MTARAAAGLVVALLSAGGARADDSMAELSLDGKPAALDFVEQAVFRGEDVTARLAALGIPLNRFAEGFDAALARLPKAQRDKLVADGLLLDRSAGVGESATR
ncbi:DUF4424 family protein [Methylocella sp.]|uniref:DUF4424 family protein n=1 Tax=Methylocella sp. TaxID=1978226 RepID=UPI0035AE2E83